VAAQLSALKKTLVIRQSFRIIGVHQITLKGGQMKRKDKRHREAYQVARANKRSLAIARERANKQEEKVERIQTMEGR